jgi:beclin 1
MYGICKSSPASLRRTNVLNDAFHIWHYNHFGTINGFRIGMLPSLGDVGRVSFVSALPFLVLQIFLLLLILFACQKVSWDEINAGFGQTILLVSSLAEFLKYEFRL